MILAEAVILVLDPFSLPLTHANTQLIQSYEKAQIGLNFSSAIQYSVYMEDRTEKNAPWMSVPQFGDWDQKGPLPDYSMDFSKIREMRKKNKRDVSRASHGNEEELISKSTASTTVKPTPHSNVLHHHFDQDNSPTARRSFLSYFNCCVKA